MGMYEPIHGSAPDIAGKDLANPLATILSTAMMLRHSFGLEQEACEIEAAVGAVLDAGYRTTDIARRGKAGLRLVGTKAMGEAVLRVLEGREP
jgi:3-isopropylmalate dehydrogenase